MNRRVFIQKMFFSLQTMLLMRFSCPEVLLAGFEKMAAGKLHYKPLNGRSLRDISLGKEHHNNGVFINPVGFSRKGRYLQLLKWKLSKNRFRPYLKDQPTRRISIDWEPVEDIRAYQLRF